MISASRLSSSAAQYQRLRALITHRRPWLSAHRREQLAARFWWPFEVGTDLPALTARGAGPELPPYLPDRNGTDLVIMLQHIQRRIALQRLLILATRTTWLALLVTLVLFLVRFVTTVPWSVIIGAGAVVVLLGVLYYRQHPVTTWTAARILDRHLHLGEQLATAVELAITPNPLRLAPRQLLSALEAMRELRASHAFRPRLPWAEFQVAFSIALLVAGLSLVIGPAERLAPPANPLSPEGSTAIDLDELGITDPSQLSQLTGEYDGMMNGSMDYPGSEGMDLSGIDSATLRQAAELSNQSARELEHIAEALKDASITSQAAQDIQAGDYQAAAQQISDLAKTIDTLSPEARQDLAERIRQAAQNIEAIDPEMARRLEQASKAVASRSDRAAAQGLEDLSKAIAETGQNVIPQSQLAQAMQEAGMGNEGMDEFGPGMDGQGQPNGAGQPVLGEGDGGEFGFASAESALGIGSAMSGLPGEDAGSGSSAGQGSGADNEQHTPRLNPDSERVEVISDQGTGPTAPRLGQAKPGAPDVITAGPGTTGPGNVPQGNLPITTGLDSNRVPRGLRNVVEGYFRTQR